MGGATIIWQPIPRLSRFQSTLPVGGATAYIGQSGIQLGFQSTLPVGGATKSLQITGSGKSNFNPRSPWGERLLCRLAYWAALPFQSTLPVGGATIPPVFYMLIYRFQSTLPVGGATINGLKLHSRVIISIHAPRGGSDSLIWFFSCSDRDFNPRSPWGERRLKCWKWFCNALFQSTLPVGGATAKCSAAPRWTSISIHAPRGGSDPAGMIATVCTSISIHAPRGGSDSEVTDFAPRSPNFNPRSPWGERLVD